MSQLDNYKISYDGSLVGRTIWIQCTWANVFAYPEHIKGFCIRTYNRFLVSDFYRNSRNRMIGQRAIKLNQIGFLTGNYHRDAKGVLWLHAELAYCDRRTEGWFRERDIWHSGKASTKPNAEPGTVEIPNSIDWPYIPYTPPVTADNGENSGDVNQPEKKSNWLTWLLAGLSAISMLR